MTVKALVDCLVIIIFMAVATTSVIGVAQEPAGPRVTLPTDVSVTPFVQAEWCAAVTSALFMDRCSSRQ